ncbi:MAG: glycosyltransferase family 1 protein, partial [Microcella sp.]|nr:glycosyltransferase family 1 protein [Microcella sp.]
MLSASPRPRLLIISFSNIARDARVLKQVALFRDDYAVTTCGFGEAPDGVADHVQIPRGLTAAKPYSKLLQLRLFRVAYWRQSGPQWVQGALRGRKWHAVLANDPESLPVAFALAPAALVHADLHEYSPRMREHWPKWSRINRPYYEWLIRRFAARAASRTSVSQGLIDEYRRVFGIEVGLVTNAAPFQSLEPRPTGSPIRLVHSGGALQHRGLEEIVDGVARSTADVTLDLYLVPTDPALIERLRADACDRVTIHDPVPYAELAALLNTYDVGLH